MLSDISHVSNSLRNKRDNYKAGRIKKIYVSSIEDLKKDLLEWKDEIDENKTFRETVRIEALGRIEKGLSIYKEIIESKWKGLVWDN